MLFYTYVVETMEPFLRDLAEEEAIENIIADDIDAPESPSIYLNPSGDGEDVDRTDGTEVDRRDGEADNSDDGESDNSDDGEDDGQLAKSGEVYIRCLVSCIH